MRATGCWGKRTNDNTVLNISLFFHRLLDYSHVATFYQVHPMILNMQPHNSNYLTSLARKEKKLCM